MRRIPAPLLLALALLSPGSADADPLDNVSGMEDWEDGSRPKGKPEAAEPGDTGPRDGAEPAGDDDATAATDDGSGAERVGSRARRPRVTEEQLRAEWREELEAFEESSDMISIRRDAMAKERREFKELKERIAEDRVGTPAARQAPKADEAEDAGDSKGKGKKSGTKKKGGRARAEADAG